MRLRYRIRFPGGMTIASAHVAEAALLELGSIVERVDAGGGDGETLTCEVDVKNIEQAGEDRGPAEWARAVVELPEPSEMQAAGEGARVLLAISLDDWWDEFGDELRHHGAVRVDDPWLVTG